MGEFFTDVIDFFNIMVDWFTVGIYDFFTELVAYWIEAATLLYLKKMYFMITFSWDVAKVIMDDLNISAHINSAWSALPSETRSILGFFKVPECINTIISGFVTKFVLRFLPRF